MLDEDEFKVVSELYRQAFSLTEEFRQNHNISIENTSIDERFRPVREAYEKMTGVKNCHHNAVIHHRISNYGDLCVSCGKPLRTPQAAFCAACGQVKD